MHPNRWGDPASATPLPEAARGLIELAFGLDERPAVEAPDVPVGALDEDLLDGLRAIVGADHVLVDDEIGAFVPAASRRPTCSAPGPATSPTPPTPWSGPTPTTRSWRCSPTPSSTGSPWS